MASDSKARALLRHPRYVFLFLLHRCSHLIKSDKFYYQCQYRLITGKKLDFEHPVSYNEKLQWLKLYDRKPIYTTMVDKLAVKQYVADRIGEQYVVPLYGVWNKPEDIDYDALPNKFVLKTTHGGGGLDVVICKDKDTIDKDKVNAKLNHSLHSDYWRMREWPYKNVPRKIIAEQLLEDESGDLPDYKVLCFNGNPYLIWVHRGRSTHHTMDIFDSAWRELPVTQPGYPPSNDKIDKPTVLEEMLALSRRLSQGIPQLRVDWYIAGGELYFGELTFYDGAGFAQWEPEEWEKKLGDMIILPKSIVSDES